MRLLAAILALAETLVTQAAGQATRAAAAEVVAVFAPAQAAIQGRAVPAVVLVGDRINGYMERMPKP